MSEWVETWGLEGALRAMATQRERLGELLEIERETQEARKQLEDRGIDPDQVIADAEAGSFSEVRYKLAPSVHPDWHDDGIDVEAIGVDGDSAKQHWNEGDIRSRLDMVSNVWGPLNEAHPVTISVEQMSALPTMERDGSFDWMWNWVRDMRLPFDPLWIGIDYSNTPKSQLIEWGSSMLVGWLIGRGMMPDENGVYHDQLQVVPWIRPVDRSDDCTFYFGWFTMADEGPVIETVLEHDDEKIEALANMLTGDIAPVFKALFFLESSNVEIVEAPVSRQVRRNAARHDKRISLAVHIRQTPRKQPVPRGGKANYSHRFEVRGHYKHHGEGTPFYRNTPPDKQIPHPHRPGEMCARLWCPPFIKGPADAVFIPKVRIVDDEPPAESEAA